MRYCVLLGVAAATMIGQVAQAEIGLTAKMSVPLGPGAEVTLGLTDNFNARVGYNWMDFTFDLPFIDDDVEAGIEWNGLSVLLDWHPGGTSFRFSAGLVALGTLSIVSTPSDSITIGDLEYEVDLISGTAEVRDWAPYAGIGFGNAGQKSGFHFAFDLGLAMVGSPNIELDAIARPVGLSGLPDALLQVQLARDLQKEEEKLEEDAESIEWIPVLSFGVSYTF